MGLTPNRADDESLIRATVTMLGRMFLTMLAELDKQGSLSPNSDFRNLGLVMGLYASDINAKQSDFFP